MNIYLAYCGDIYEEECVVLGAYNNIKLAEERIIKDKKDNEIKKYVRQYYGMEELLIDENVNFCIDIERAHSEFNLLSKELFTQDQLNYISRMEQAKIQEDPEIKFVSVKSPFRTK